jgi:2'-5' RNA ligase
MPHAVVLYFKEEHEKKFLKIWGSLASEHLSTNLVKAEIRPHITLAIFDELNCKPCEPQIKDIASQTPPLDIQITHLGLFTKPDPVVFAAPTFTQNFLNFHSYIHDVLVTESKNPWEMYLPGMWVPHCTLALGFKFKDLGRIFEKCLDLDLPMNIKADQVGVVEFQPMKDVYKYRLIWD